MHLVPIIINDITNSNHYYSSVDIYFLYNWIPYTVYNIIEYNIS